MQHNNKMKDEQFPCLLASTTASLHFLEKQLLDHCGKIEDWFKTQWRMTSAPLYGSVDLRNSGFKLAPVDMNLFPAGFNNLNPMFFQQAVKAAAASITQSAPQAKNILLIPENHSRNPYYWENISAIIKILNAAGFEVSLGSLSNELKQPHTISLMDGTNILLEPIDRINGQLKTAKFTPDLVVLNNDLSEGIPELLLDLKIPVLPPPELGWGYRSKSNHFRYYQQIAEEFAQLLQIDPWLIAAYFRQCDEIDFMQRVGETTLLKNGEELFAAIQKKYDEFNISARPFLVMKADAGTYGMAIMTIRSIDELQNLNRKQRTKMATTKGNRPVTRVILQEGVYTFETWGTDNAVAEPVVYLWGQQVAGGFYRVHKERGIDENLNSPGMHFETLPFVTACDKPNHGLYAYGVIARLSMLAAARESITSKKINN